jgi:two-component sensor histidine kinase
MSDLGLGAAGGDLFRDLIENLPAAVCANDAERRVLWCNRAMRELNGSETPVGSDGLSVELSLFLPDGTPLPPEAWPIAVAFREQRAVRGIELLVEQSGGRRTPFIAYAMPLRDSAGNFSGTINMLVDISDRRESEANSRALLSQFIHRENNGMQIIRSLLAGAEREAAHPEAKKVLIDTSRRVGAVAAAQNAITRTGSGALDAHLLLESLCQFASQNYGPKLDIRLESAMGSLTNRAAVPLAIIVNELISNSVNHGRGERSRVAVRISLTTANGAATLTVQDDGPGFEAGVAKRRASGLGLVQALARQLGGALEVTAQHGARCVIRFTETPGS